MRRGSSTVIAIVGDVNAELLDRLSGPSNVVVFDPPATGPDGAMEALARAGSLQAPYSIVPADPLSHLAAEWQKMWTPGSVEHRFEERAGEVIAAWRRGRLELPDYYMVVLDAPVSPQEPEPARPHRFDFHLGGLRSQRSARVAEVVASEAAETAARVLHALSTLRQGPWWPDLDVLVDAVRSFFPGRLATGSDLKP
jgi:hypothetical protein